MKRSGALEILKENYAHLCTKDEIEPQYDI